MRPLAFLALFGLALVAGAQVAPPTEGAGSAAALSSPTPEGAGRAAAGLFLRKAPGILRGRVALAWSPADSALTERLSRSLAQSDPAFLIVADLGVRAGSLPEAMAQLDSDTFSGLLWIEAHLGPGGELVGVSLFHRPLAGGEESRLDIRFDPPLGAGPSPSAGPQELLSESLPSIGGRVEAALLDAAEGRFWYLTAGGLALRELGAAEDLQRWTPGEGGAQPSGPGVLRSAGESGGDRRIGWSTGGKGIWLVPRSGQWGRGGALEGFPLTEREARFLRAPWLDEEGLYALLNHQGEELAKFRQMVRIRDASGESLLVLLGGDGSLRAFRGNTLESVPVPAEGTFGALAGSGDLVALVEGGDPPRLRIVRATGGPLWEEPWKPFPLPSRASALTVAQAQSGASCLAFLPQGESTGVLLLRPGVPPSVPITPAVPDSPGGGPEPPPKDAPEIP